MNQLDRISVCAGWLEHDPAIGVAYIDRARGNEVISFEYRKGWLQEHPGVLLDPDLMQMTGRQYCSKEKPCFGFLSDTAPDRWGRKLMDRRESIDAAKGHRSKAKLLESDYILGVYDEGRTGGLRFQDAEGHFLSERSDWKTPPMEELRDLEHASLEMESNTNHDEQWLKTLLAPGSSLGGARPKANVVDVDGSLWIAKFPSKNDVIDSGAWEMVAHDLAQLCELRVPEAKLLKLSKYGSTFLSKRFDRQKQGAYDRRIHFASAMTMLGETDRSHVQHSYLDLLSFLEEHGAHPDQDALELWKRIIFNLCITNADDHLRNHGFLLENDRWTLSPAYDMNPVYDQEQLSLSINFEETDRKLEHALEVSEYYRVQHEEALEMIQKTRSTIKRQWRYLAKKYRISKEEQDLMQPAFAECERELDL